MVRKSRGGEVTKFEYDAVSQRERSTVTVVVHDAHMYIHILYDIVFVVKTRYNFVSIHGSV